MGIFQGGNFLVDGNFPKGQVSLATSIFHDRVLFYAVTTDVKNLLENIIAVGEIATRKNLTHH